MSWIFLDESGQFSKNGNQSFFVVGSFTTGDPNRTKKGFKSWQVKKFPKKQKGQSEIKFSDIKIDDSLRLNTLKNISNLDIRIMYVFLHRDNIPSKYRKKNKVTESGLLYVNVIGELLEMYLPCTDKEFRIFCDKRHLKGISTTDFKKILTNRLVPQLPPSTNIQIEMIDSTTNSNIQIADWISGALGRFYNNGEIGEQCKATLESKIVAEKELFKDYWSKKQKTRT
ncbi:TPA: hypothetical protein DCP77_01710 [Candidatus Collierbacteria bacterium]|nr:hypothetical protein [Candidatus Collierbacteria bacterium]HAS68983.1 hypothetical protein [Candidatus Collierbacteria bacterium]HBX64505.1 hypothetical protein [Candidatus Collierbacteria bacterium]HCW31183.1 hypothetical protein [Candidatus Collierbacteria bacterium]